MAIQTAASPYPATFDIAYPERLSRLTTFFRTIIVLPVYLLATLVGTAAGYLVFATVLMLLFRNKYPQVWFNWALYMMQFNSRISSYMLLLVDEYPSTTDTQRISANATLEEGRLNRFLPLVKWILLIPHLIVLVCLYVAVLVVTLVAWFAILITGKYPRGMHDFVVGVVRWGWRVQAYALLLSTDRYPPFSLK